MGIPVLIAHGPNSLDIPCRVFNCLFEEAKERMVKLLGFASIGEDGKVSWSCQEVDGSDGIGFMTPSREEIIARREARTVARQKFDENNGETDKSFFEFFREEMDGLMGDGFPEGKITPAKEIFTEYYGGCGEVCGFTLKEMESDTPFVNWNLD